MAGQEWGTASLGGNLAQAYLTKWLRTYSQPLTRLRQLCDVKEAIGKYRGDTFNWDIVSNIATEGTSVAETDTVPASNFTVSKGTLTVTEFANSIPFTRKLMAMSQHEIKSLVRTALANDMAKALDRHIFRTIQSNAVLVYQASAGTDTANVELMTDGTGDSANAVALGYDHIVNIVDSMKERNIPTFDGENYICISHPSTLTNLRIQMASVNQYTETGYAKILNGEIGKVNGMRFVEQTNIAKVTPTTIGGWAMFVGGEAIIEAISIPEEVIVKEITDYGRSLGLAWYCLLGYGLAWPAAQVAQQRIAFWWPNASAVSSLSP